MCVSVERLLEYAASHIQHMQKALTEMNLRPHHVVADINGTNGLRIIRASLAGERDPEVLARSRHYSWHSSAETIAKALTGRYRTEHLFALEQALTLYDAYHEQGRHRTDQPNALAFDVRAALLALLGKDITRPTALVLTSP